MIKGPEDEYTTKSLGHDIYVKIRYEYMHVRVHDKLGIFNKHYNCSSYLWKNIQVTKCNKLA